MKEEKITISIAWFIITVCSIILLFIIVQMSHIEPYGIGGFVQKEIEWTQQTYNVMKENCNSNFGSIGGIFYDRNKKQLHCYQNECVDGDYCKVIDYYFPVTVAE